MQIARNRLHAESFKHHHLFDLELQRTQSELAVKGLGHSGALVQAVADVCAQEIERRSERLWEIVRELLGNVKSVPSNEAVNTLYGQIDELWVAYCSSDPERQFQAICQRDSVGRALIDATNFTNRQIGAASNSDGSCSIFTFAAKPKIAHCESVLAKRSLAGFQRIGFQSTVENLEQYRSDSDIGPDSILPWGTKLATYRTRFGFRARCLHHDQLRCLRGQSYFYSTARPHLKWNRHRSDA